MPSSDKRSYGYIGQKRPQKPKRQAPVYKQRPPKRPKRKKVRKNRGPFFVYFLGFLVVCFLFSTIAVAWMSRDLPDPDRLTDRQVAQSTKIYDRTGEHLLFEVFADEKRTLVELSDIPDHLINGVIATEDTAFFEHKGIRPLSILRALVQGLLPGKRIQGTSTLTQQLVKNAILSNERKISRKIKEIILSVRLEQKYDKEQILKIYFNEIPYGSTNYGIESAAQSYFGKPTSELTLAESATLAGMPKAPSRYLNDKEALLERRNFVLKRMHDEGFISQQEKEDAQEEELELDVTYGNIKAPHFVLHVKELLVESYGEQAVDSGGLKVITSLDWEMQQSAEKAIQEVSEERFEEAQANNASLVAIDPDNGHILAMVGSRDFLDEDIDGQFNVATQGLRQPGSSFKPIVYTAAFEKGYTPETVLFDVETNFAVAGDDYEPKNYDLKEHGPVSMRQALQGSLNIAAVKALYLVGPLKGVDFAERLGYSTLSQGDFGLSLVLGGGEVRLLEHVSAYGIFANEGVRHEPVSIISVEDNTGDILEEWKKSKGERVLEEETAHLISNVLSDDQARAYAFGTGGVLTLPERPVAAKTGTTNAYVDAWTVGYTPSLVAGVWAGNTDNTPMKRGFGGSKVAGPIWRQFMIEALQGKPVESFPEPPENDAEKPALRGSAGGNITLKVDKVTGKLATSSTPERYIVERTYIQPHSILHYVNKDDPRAKQPSNPSSDSQYQIWEDSIKDWIKRTKEENPDWEISFEEPPTEYDDLHSLELIPSLEVIFPSPSSTLNSRQIDTDIRVSAPRGVSKVTYKIDGKYVAVVREHPFNLNHRADDLDPGPHTLTILVEDDIGNRITEEVSFNLNVSKVNPAVFFAQEELQLRRDDFPKTLLLNHRKIEEIKSVSISTIPTDQRSEGEKTVGTVTKLDDLFNNQITFSWRNPPETGNYELIAKVKTNVGTFESHRIPLTVQ